jgi:hypothetical protein
MKLPRFSGILCIAFLMLAALIAGCTSGTTPAAPPVSPIIPATNGTTSCGFTTCHGLDLACGPNPPQVCTMEYQLGDKCRQFASCTNANGSCRLVTTPQYDNCKACVQKCGGADATEIFTCEEKC